MTQRSAAGRGRRWFGAFISAAVAVPVLAATPPPPPPDDGAEAPRYGSREWREERQKNWPEIERQDPIPVRSGEQLRSASAVHRLETADSTDVNWPEPGAASVELSTGRTTDHDLPVRVRNANGRAASEPGQMRVELLDHKRAESAGADGLLLRLTPEQPGNRTRVELTVDYSSFADAMGGDWSSRLRLVELPLCALTTPSLDTCRTGTPLASSTNRSDDQVVTGVTSVAEAGTVVALAASTSGPTGDWAATPLSPSATWSVSGNTGAFSWTYPLRTVPGVGGPEPDLALSYGSASLDGRVASTNNQSSWLGDGWEMWPGYIERKYVTCADDMTGGNNSSRKTGDLCWKSDNASIVFGGTATELVKDESSGQWRLKDDDGSRIEHLTDGFSSNPVKDDEYWRLTTPDGVQYYFGSTQRYAGDTARTASIWYAPVYGNHAGEPCHAASFADSDCRQAWRWNLDYVVDPSGNTMTYFYAAEGNRYGANLNTASAFYRRGGYLDRIEYGQRKGSEHTTPAPMRVSFATSERCLSDCGSLTSSTADNWPDVPYDLICTSATSCAERLSPSFFTRKRLTGITTEVRSGSSYRTVDEWSLAHTFPDPGDATDPVLWLDSIQHTAGTVTLPKVTFGGEQMANRVDEIGDNGPPMNRHRLIDIRTEAGAKITVNYTSKDCGPSDLPSAPDSNSRRCFPVYWTPEGFSDPIREYFHKYLTTSVVEDPVNGDSWPVEAHYAYSGGAAWAYDDSELTPKKYRTWGQFRGYPTVTTTTGAPTESPRSKTVTTYLRGMDGDRLSGGGSRGVSVEASDGSSVTDRERFSGMVREEIVYNGTSGGEVSGTINTPWQSSATATGADGTTARLAGIQQVDGRITAPNLTNGVRKTQTITTFDSTYGLPTEVDDRGDTSTTADNLCTRYSYARSTSKHIVATVSREETVSVKCDDTPLRPGDVVSDKRSMYDGGVFGAAPTRGLVTDTQEVKSYSGGTPTYVTTATTAYDAHGRVTSVKDALDRETTTAYTPATGGPVTQTKVTNPAGHVTTTVLDPAWGVPTKVTDPNSKVTEASYDGLGRLRGVWLPGRVKGTNSAHIAYTYTVRTTGLNAVTTGTLTHDGTRVPSVTLFDGLLRPRQTQTTPADASAGRVITDTIYDSRGLVEVKNSPWYATGAPSTTYVVPTSAVPGRTRYVYDGAERVTAEIVDVAEQEQWRTTTTYGGDRVTVDPPDGGTPTTTITDARDRTTEVRQYTTGSPSGSYQTTSYAYDHAGRLAGMTDPAGNEWGYGYDLLGRQTSSDDPDRGVTSSTFDDAGQLITSTDARGETLYRGYDDLGRQMVLREGSSSGTVLSKWIYDTVAKGQLSSSTRYVAGEAYTTSVTGYDDGYRPLGQTVSVPSSVVGLGGSYTTSYAYTLDGLPKSVTYPGGGGLPSEIVTTDYRPGISTPWRMGGPFGWGAYVAGSEWSPYGEPLFIDAGTNYATMLNYSYQLGTRRLDKTWLDRQYVDGYEQDVTYSYDDAGNVTKIADQATAAGVTPDTQCFEYDGLRRLTQAWTPGSGGCTTDPSVSGLGGAAPYWQSWTFDEVGNRLTQTDHAVGGDTVATYTYPAAGQPRPHAPTQVTTSGPSGSGSRSFGYDAAGNTTTREHDDVEQSLGWDIEGRLASVTAAGVDDEFVYTADGGRLLRREGTSTTLYLAGGMEITHDTADGTTRARRYYSFNGQTIAVRTALGVDGVTTLVADHHGTGQVAVDNGTNVAIHRYSDPYGSPRGADALAWPGDHGFLEKPLDESTGLTSVGARYYDTIVGRFISVDPVMDLTDPQQWHGYAYANNNPLTWADPSGEAITECSGGCTTNGGLGRTAVRSKYHGTRISGDKPKVVHPATWYPPRRQTVWFPGGTLYRYGGSKPPQINGQRLPDGGPSPAAMAMWADAVLRHNNDQVPNGPGTAFLTYSLLLDACVEHRDTCSREYQAQLQMLRLDTGEFDRLAGGGRYVVGGALREFRGQAESATPPPGTIVIGETMERVKGAVRELRSTWAVNAKWYQTWEKNWEGKIDFEKNYRNNARWISSKMNNGFVIYDIGLDENKTRPSPFYGLERESAMERGYWTVPYGY